MAKATLFHSAITPDLSEIFLESWKGGHQHCVQHNRQKTRAEALNHRAHNEGSVTTRGNIYN